MMLDEEHLIVEMKDDHIDAQEAKDYATAEEDQADVHTDLPHIVRSKMIYSDITGMKANELLMPSRHTRSDISDMFLEHKLPSRSHPYRRRQISSSDVITKSGQAPNLRYEDLKLADAVASYGTRRVRQASGISDKQFTDTIEEHREEEFEDFHYGGLSSEQADKLLAKYGKNELSEHVDPKWLLFLRQFYAPMPIMIW